jgi:hypothetical protein
MEESLKNDDLIRQLCAQQDSTMDQPPVSVDMPVAGKRLLVQCTFACQKIHLPATPSPIFHPPSILPIVLKKNKSIKGS